MNTLNQVSEIKNVRELAQLFNTEQISKCIDDQIETQSNSCEIFEDNIKALNTLARAGVIRQLLDKGVSLPEATRQLGRRMRNEIFNM